MHCRSVEWLPPTLDVVRLRSGSVEGGNPVYVTVEDEGVALFFMQTQGDPALYGSEVRIEFSAQLICILNGAPQCFF